MNALNINHKNRLFMVFEKKLQGTVRIRPNAHKEGQLNLYKSIRSHSQFSQLRYFRFSTLPQQEISIPVQSLFSLLSIFRVRLNM